MEENVKTRNGDYVTYKIDWLLEHVAEEIWLLMCEKKAPTMMTVDDLEEMARQNKVWHNLEKEKK